MGEESFNDLNFVLINNPGTSPEIIDMVFRRIPKELFEQIKDFEFNIELLYQTPSSFINNINTRFYVLTDSEEKIKGILWAYVNVLTEKIQINILSVDREFQFGNALERTLEFVKSWQGKDENITIEIVTKKPGAYEKAGLKRSKKILMEWKNE